MTQKKKFSKDNVLVVSNDKFIYLSEIYILWKGGASLYDTQYYSSDKPIKFKKNKVKKKNYTIYRFITLEFAPENWLLRNGYKPI